MNLNPLKGCCKVKKPMIFIILMTILPWFSLPLLGKDSFKKFLPGALFMAFYLMAEGRLAEKRKWWWFPFNVKPNVLGEMPLIWGPFFIGSFWISKYTYKKFNLYLFINLMVDGFFVYFILDWFKKIGYASLIRINKFQLSMIFLIKSLVMYGFQVFYDTYVRGNKSNTAKGSSFSNDIKVK
jgi:hypothetical protein